jgi:hypothetical protein
LAKKTGLGAGVAVVNRLTAGLDNMYHTLVCDNFFTSPALFHNLLRRGMYAVGTIRRYWVGFPKSLNVGDNEVCDTLHLKVHRDRFMSAVHWADCKGVAFLSIAANLYEHGCQVQRNIGVERITLSYTLQQFLYSQYMWGVDVQDALRALYTVQIATKHWWTWLYFFGLDSTLTNSFIIYREVCAHNGTRPMEQN